MASKPKPPAGQPLTYEVMKCHDHHDTWLVEAIDHASEGEVYSAIFSGPGAEERAWEYANFKNRSQPGSREPVVTMNKTRKFDWLVFFLLLVCGFFADHQRAIQSEKIQP